MFIQTEVTPNPATLKFLPGRPVMSEGVVDFTEAAKAEAVSPLAARLFAIDASKQAAVLRSGRRDVAADVAVLRARAVSAARARRAT